MRLLDTVRKKVWLCVNVAFLGFIVATGFALYTNQQLKIQLLQIRDLDFVLALRSAELLNQFDAQKIFYEESFLFGLPESAQKAGALATDILSLFQSIAEISHSRLRLEPEQTEPLTSIEKRYRAYASQATQLYPLLALGEDPNKHIEPLQNLAATQSSLHEQIESLSNYYRDSFGRNVTDLIDLASQNNRLLTVFFLSVLGFMTLVVNIAANRTLIHPLAQIKEAVRAFGQGQRTFPQLQAMDAEDDVGELGVALVKMASDLETTTVSKAYVDNILRNMSDSLIVVADDLSIRSVNQATLTLLGYSSAELTGQHIGKILRELQDSAALGASAGADPKSPRPLCSNAEKTYLRRDGCKIPVLLSTSPLQGSDGSAQGMVYVAKDITERKQAEYKLEQLAQYDFLTGLPNRLSFSERLQQSLCRAQREERRMGLMFLDLDRFKIINDTLGHSHGDVLLKTLAKRLGRCIRESDTVARLGGDEFAVVVDNIQQEDVIQTATRILAAFIKPVFYERKEFSTSASIGIAIFPEDGNSTEDLLRKADFAMYQAKQAGGNNYRFFSDPSRQSPPNKVGS